MIPPYGKIPNYLTILSGNRYLIQRLIIDYSRLYRLSTSGNSLEVPRGNAANFRAQEANKYFYSFGFNFSVIRNK